MCNSNAVDKMNYQSKVRKQTLALMTSATYRRDLNLDEER